MNDQAKLVLSDLELKVVLVKLRARFVLSLISYCDDPEYEIKYLLNQMDRDIMTFNDVYLRSFNSFNN